MNLSRRRFLIGASAVAAAAVIKANIPPAAIEPGAYISEPPAWVPKGWLIPQGQSVSRVLFPRLFEALGDSFGEAGTTAFRLPDLTTEIPALRTVNQIMGTRFQYLICADDNPDRNMPVGAILPFAVPEA